MVAACRVVIGLVVFRARGPGVGVAAAEVGLDGEWISENHSYTLRTDDGGVVFTQVVQIPEKHNEGSALPDTARFPTILQRAAPNRGKNQHKKTYHAGQSASLNEVPISDRNRDLT